MLSIIITKRTLNMISKNEYLIFPTNELKSIFGLKVYVMTFEHYNVY